MQYGPSIGRRRKRHEETPEDYRLSSGWGGQLVSGRLSVSLSGATVSNSVYPGEEGLEASRPS